MAKTVTPTEVSIELKKLFADFSNANYEVRQIAVQKAAEYLKEELEKNSPTDSGEYAKSWAIKTKYSDRRYVGNTKIVENDGEDVALSDLLEYSDNHAKPHIRKTYDSCEQQIYQIIENEINNGGK